MMPDALRDTIVHEITIRGTAATVFDALTDPEQLVQWWAIDGRFQATQVESDLRPDGHWLMRGIRANGGPFTVRGTYRLVDRPRALMFTWLPDWQGDTTETLVRIDLAEHNGITTVRLTHSGLVTDATRTSHQGWPLLLDRLRAQVELDRSGRS